MIRGLEGVERERVYLLPRRLQSFRGIMDRAGCLFSPLKQVPGVALFLLHMFILVARKESDGS